MSKIMININVHGVGRQVDVSRLSADLRDALRTVLDMDPSIRVMDNSNVDTMSAYRIKQNMRHPEI